MPAQDKTGPSGLGPKTGRQLGNCEGAVPVVGRGFGCGMRRGFGRGMCFGRNIALSKDEEKQILVAEKQEIEARLKELD